MVLGRICDANYISIILSMTTTYLQFGYTRPKHFIELQCNLPISCSYILESWLPGSRQISNACLSKPRYVIQSTFGMAAANWRVLTKSYYMNPGKIANPLLKLAWYFTTFENKGRKLLSNKFCRRWMKISICSLSKNKLNNSYKRLSKQCFYNSTGTNLKSSSSIYRVIQHRKNAKRTYRRSCDRNTKKIFPPKCYKRKRENYVKNTNFLYIF